MSKEVIHTNDAPQPIGCYSQGIRSGSTIYLSGQIPLDPKTGNVVSEDFREQTVQVFKNMQAMVKASSATMNDIVKLTIFLTDMSNFPIVNEVMQEYFQKPYPARTSIGVAALPKNVKVEAEAVLVI